MTNASHTPGPWLSDLHYIVAPDPNGVHSDIYIAEIAESDEEGRIASIEQQIANGKLIAAAPALLEALKQAVIALNEARRFPVPSLLTDSYAIAALCDRVIHEAHP